LDLTDTSLLEKFEFRVDRTNLPSTPGWLYRTLWKIHAPSFKEFTISLSNCSSTDDLRTAMSGEDWKTVDAYLFVWSKFQPGFKVVFRVDLGDDEVIPVGKFVGQRFPLVSKKGIMKIEQVQRWEALVAV
jgi:hypothetical protein